MRWVAPLVLTVLPGWAPAHPVDEIVQGAYLTLVPGEVRLELEVAPGSEVAGRVLRALDPDGDGAVSDDETQAFAQEVLAQSILTLDANAAEWVLDGVQVPPLDALATGHAVLTIMATARRPEISGDHVLVYENRYEPAKSLWMANVFLQPGPEWTYSVAGQDRTDNGQGLTVRYATASP